MTQIVLRVYVTFLGDCSSASFFVSDVSSVEIQTNKHVMQFTHYRIKRSILMNAIPGKQQHSLKSHFQENLGKWVKGMTP